MISEESAAAAAVPDEPFTLSRAALVDAGACGVIQIFDRVLRKRPGVSAPVSAVAAAGHAFPSAAAAVAIDDGSTSRANDSGDLVFPKGWTEAHSARLAAISPRALRFLVGAKLIPVTVEQMRAALAAALKPRSVLRWPGAPEIV